MISPVAPFTGAWIEINRQTAWIVKISVAPFTGAWIEITSVVTSTNAVASHPSRVRGLKYGDVRKPPLRLCGRTLHGCVD